MSTQNNNKPTCIKCISPRLEGKHYCELCYYYIKNPLIMIQKLKATKWEHKTETFDV